MEQKFKVGDLVQITCPNPKLLGQVGCITSINENSTLPIHVTINSDNHETDFSANELQHFSRGSKEDDN